MSGIRSGWREDSDQPKRPKMPSDPATPIIDEDIILAIRGITEAIGVDPPLMRVGDELNGHKMLEIADYLTAAIEQVRAMGRTVEDNVSLTVEILGVLATQALMTERLFRTLVSATKTLQGGRDIAKVLRNRWR